MIISHKYKLIFIHIYKNAGTFVTELLYNLDRHIIDCDGHISAKDAKKKYPKLWNDYTKICIIRNSWDWQISLLAYMKESIEHHQHHIVKNMNVNEYLQWRKTDLHQQLEFITDDNEDCLIDNILLFDNLNENIKNFFRNKYNTDISFDMPLQKTNTSNRHSDYRKYYNDNDKQILYDMHLPDIKKFNFEF